LAELGVGMEGVLLVVALPRPVGRSRPRKVLTAVMDENVVCW
jgi:hypothetical protein